MLFERQRKGTRERNRELPSDHSPVPTAAASGLGQNQELNPQLPYRWQELNHLSQQGSGLAGSWSEEPELGMRSRNTYMGCGTLNTELYH